ncbi:hypothetical protein ACHAXT_007613 [Thalassiosira profunda]
MAKNGAEITAEDTGGAGDEEMLEESPAAADEAVPATDTDEAEDNAPSAPPVAVTFDYEDHFSLRQPSSTIRSRGVTTRVYDVGNEQLQLQQSAEADDEKKGGVKITARMKLLGGTNLGLLFLRMLYGIVALLVAGFAAVFAVNVIVMQAMEIPRSYGAAAGTALNVPVLVANILSLPLLVYSMASLVLFCLVFAWDVWTGHRTLRLLLPERVPRVALEWYAFVLYLAVPMLVFSIAAFAGANAGEIGGLAWYVCMLFGFFVFCALVFANEVKLCLDLTRLQYPELRSAQLLMRAVLTTLTERYCGVESRYFLVRKGGGGGAPTASTLGDNPPVRTSRSLLSRIRSLSKNPFFHQLDSPKRWYSIEELQETNEVITNKSWSLDKACCGLRNRSAQYAVSGPDALERDQARSGLACTMLGIHLGALFLLAILYAAGMATGAAGIIIVYLLVLVCIGIPCSWSAYQVFRASAMPPDDGGDDEEDEVLRTRATFVVAKPKEWYCWSRLGLAFVLFFLWPAVTFFTQNLPKSGVIFLFTSIFSGIRLNLGAAALLREHSTLGKVKFVDADDDKSGKREMLARARAAQLLSYLTNSTFYLVWIIAFAVLGGFVIYYGASSVGSGEDYNTQTGREPIRLLEDFKWGPQNDTLLYPNCQLTNHFAIPGLENSYAMDYNLIGGLAYEVPNVTEYVLDKWFLQSGAAVEEVDLVDQWREDSGNSEEQVSFKLLSFPSTPGVGVLSIRGTETPMDRLYNFQFYMPSVLTAVVRAVMPFSWLFDPIYPSLLLSTSWVVSDHLAKSDYYRITTEFANDLLNGYTDSSGKTFQWLRTTGVSLGGGLALITGAQTDAHGFAFSGPNPTLARKAWTPPISMQDLKERVINIKPEPDLVSSIGDVVPNHQLVQCRDWPAEVYNCHSFWRIFCEYLYSCGSPEDRAGVLCVCVSRWGYPMPERVSGNRTFEQACAEEEANLVDAVGPIFDTENMINPDLQ